MKKTSLILSLVVIISIILSFGIQTSAETTVPATYIMIDGGNWNTIALKSDGSVWTWGWNEFGQLGDGSSLDRYSPVCVPTLSDVVDVAAANGSNLALKKDGTVWIWGHAPNEVVDLLPTQVMGLSDVVDVECGSDAYYAITKDGSLWSWGGNGYGQLGDGSTNYQSQPVKLTGIQNVKQVSASFNFTAALKTDGTVWAWGANYGGQLGNGTNQNSSKPIQVKGIGRINQISAGFNFMLALDENGNVYGWGGDTYGSLGAGDNKPCRKPFRLSGLTKIRSISCGTFHTVLLKNDGTVWSFGMGTKGQLGSGKLSNSVKPVKVPVTGKSRFVSASEARSYSISEDGTVYTWGENDRGQLGFGSSATVDQPAQIKDLSGVIAVATANQWSAALKNDGSVWIWGSYSYGDYMTNLSSPASVPWSIKGLTNAMDIAAGNQGLIILKKDGTVWYYESGLKQIKGLAGITSISYNYDQGLALKKDGTVLSFGGYSIGSNKPLPVKGLTGIKQISAFWDQSLALDKSGAVWAWGSNHYGQLGDGTQIDRVLPQKIPDISNVISIAEGYAHTVFIKDDGTVWTVGFNGNYQFGDWNYKELFSLYPVQAKFIKNATKVFAGVSETFCTDKDGGLWTIGANSEAPVKIPGLSDIIDVSCASGTNLAVKKDGTVYAWGLNTYGQAGSTSTNQLLPVKLAGEMSADPMAQGVYGPLTVDASAINVDDPFKGYNLDYYNQSKINGIQFINQFRKQLGLAPVASSPMLDNSSQAHSNYCSYNRNIGHFETPGTMGFTGEDLPDRAQKYNYCGIFSEIISYQAGSVEQAIDGLIDAPYHRLALLDPNYSEVGFGISRNSGDFRATVVNLGSTCPPKSDQVMVYPYDGQQEVETVWINTEDPDPLRFFNVTSDIAGYPISLSVHDADTKELQTVSCVLTDSKGNPVPFYQADSSMEQDALFKNMILAIPKNPLKQGETYTVKINANRIKINGEIQSIEKNWSFTTSNKLKPGYARVCREGNIEHIHVNPVNGSGKYHSVLFRPNGDIIQISEMDGSEEKYKMGRYLDVGEYYLEITDEVTNETTLIKVRIMGIKGSRTVTW